MRSRLLLPSLLALLPLLPLAPDDDEPVLVMRSGEVSRAEYGRWLVTRVGHTHLDDFITERLVLQEATARGMLPDDAEVEAAWQLEYGIVLDKHFHGDELAWRAAIANTGEDPDAYARRRRDSLRAELAHLALARAERRFTEEQLRERYRDVYGNGGESLALDVLFYSAYASADADAPRQDVQALRAAALSRAGAAAAALRAGTPVAALAGDADPLSDEVVDAGLVQGTRIRQYRKRLLGQEVERAVQSLDDPGDVAGPIQVWDGAYVVQLVEREARTFEQARDEMEAMLQATPPTADELAAVRERLVQREQVERTLR